MNLSSWRFIFLLSRRMCAAVQLFDSTDFHSEARNYTSLPWSFLVGSAMYSKYIRYIMSETYIHILCSFVRMFHTSSRAAGELSYRGPFCHRREEEEVKGRRRRQVKEREREKRETKRHRQLRLNSCLASATRCYSVCLVVIDTQRCIRFCRNASSKIST